MARSILSLLNQMAREGARQQRRAAAERQRALRRQAQEARALERSQSLAFRNAERDARLQYVLSRENEATDANQELADRVAELEGILEHTLAIDDKIQFDQLKVYSDYPPFFPEASLRQPATPPAREAFVSGVQAPGLFGKMLASRQQQYELELQQAEQRFAMAMQQFEKEEESRSERIKVAREIYLRRRRSHQAELDTKNQEVDEFKAAYFAGDPTAVVGYCSMVLERSQYPEGFPQEFRVAYVPESKQVVVEYELPPPTIVPETAEFRYVKAKDEIQAKTRKPAEIRDLYQDVVAATSLRVCHELFESDQARHFEIVSFNGFVQTIDPATGRPARPCLISLSVTRDRFEELDLARVEKKICLRNLGASVSPRPYETQPVKPVVNFDMVDRRFVEGSDILSDLESRPNLYDLSPFEFENLVGNVFRQHGLETRQTRSSRDGGVDVVAFDLRPVLGGKVVIQAKRYRHTVGVSAVRDLYGTMMNEGANKGIIVSTSGYGPDAFEFAREKPIELIDGGQLLYLLEQIGVKARIILPD